ncbi:MAG: N-acetylmuramoyl-L-alanine amidase [Candidatus Omnitrophica bacterium]|nr:N-acetylmuramoyl-L-alanine amidase [Candidatus Omnitrophota bacterium]MDD5553582.1 N-acetylmuramoyl-L-alanine amidase [Candidatus Omnitrophota bacterium]
MPLSALCESFGIAWDYDALTRTATLTKGSHRINLMPGEKMVLVDGSAFDLRQPVDVHQGALVVPSRFKEQILDNLFKARYPKEEASLVLPQELKKVVIDAGHGGKDPGAIGKKGLKEKDVNLDIAKRLAKLLKSEGIEVVMTRSTDNFVSLERRVDVANNSKAGLFISIHSNANRVRSLKGLEVYYISPANDSKRALNFAKSSSLELDRSSFAQSPSLNLKTILWDMTHVSNRAESVRLAREICSLTKNNLDTNVIGIKSANFYVLKGAGMPAILVEVGFVSNLNEERLLKNAFYRQQLAETIAQAFKKYARECALREAG